MLSNILSYRFGNVSWILLQSYNNFSKLANLFDKKKQRKVPYQELTHTIASNPTVSHHHIPNTSIPPQKSPFRNQSIHRDFTET